MIPGRWSYHPVSPKIPRWRAPSPPPFTKQKFLHQAAAPSLRKGRKICGSRSSDRSKREASLLVREVLRRATFKNTPRRPRLALLSSAVSRRSFLSLSTTQALSHPPRSLTPHIHARARARTYTHIPKSPATCSCAKSYEEHSGGAHPLSQLQLAMRSRWIVNGSSDARPSINQLDHRYHTRSHLHPRSEYRKLIEIEKGINYHTLSKGMVDRYLGRERVSEWEGGWERERDTTMTWKTCFSLDPAREISCIIHRSLSTRMNVLYVGR